MPTPQVTFGCNFTVEEYWDVVEFAQKAEELGFDRITTGEHLMDGNPPRPTLLNIPVMAAAAGATRTLRVMTGIVIAPLYHPVMLSKLVTSLDLVSKGRLDFGIGVSGQRGTQVEFDALGISVRTRGRRTDEMLEVMKRLWTEEHVSHQGRFFNFEDVTLVPRPRQQPYPPIWVAGRSDAAMRRAALHGDGWYPYLFTVRRLRATNETVRKMAADAGRDPGRLPLGTESANRHIRRPGRGASHGGVPRRPTLRDAGTDRRRHCPGIMPDRHPPGLHQSH